MATSTVFCVVGTRPEAIKMAPVVRALRRRRNLTVRLLLTGQHRDLLHDALADFGLRGDLDLDLMRPDQGLSGLAARILDGIDPVLATARPAMVLAQGDTTTVMAAAIACFHRRIPFGHVEAGLRTGDLGQPFPEEFNRIVAGRAATLNFAPTEGARLALLREGVAPDSIHVTGNTVIDALLAVARSRPPLPPGLPRNGRLALLTLHRRESFGAPAERVLQAVRRLCEAVPDLHVLYPVHPNPQVRDRAHALLGGHPQVTLAGPLRYPELVAALQACTLVLTDSGGLQEEAPALGKPVLVLREVTERPEAVALGVARLVGTDPDRILAEATRLLVSPADHAAMARGVSPYGDGRAADRIAALVAAAVRPRPRPRRDRAAPPFHGSVPQPAAETAASPAAQPSLPPAAFARGATAP
ncbi:non-hydrolyzing UDP-N-acetylglucosamine 2-epimerase [Paracraurococcus ruber]|uniref:non-hydrolyzing UDP-N-acetylglucosamine 2-epimerase n=1 Tax=Paracraurococcus ruber TaxID=77675 RepID=UPI001F00DE7D|nr:UDP-N-acetylglucosamine 2-epimerase (non-hydrolyzing) [Paracraurococcus ruber]